MKGIKKADEAGLDGQHACGVPPLRGREHPRFTDVCEKRKQKRKGPKKIPLKKLHTQHREKKNS